MPKRKIWEFEGFTLCRLLGLVFDDAEMTKIFKKLKIGCAGSSAHDMHQGLIQICRTESTASKFMDKLLKDRFEQYREKINGFDTKEIVEIIERSDGSVDVPISALIWFTVRNQRDDMDELERELFYAVHSKEHQALRLYDILSRRLPDGDAENVLYRLDLACKLNKKLERNLNRSNQIREKLKSGIKAIESDKDIISVELGEQKKINKQLSGNFEQIGGKEALEYIENLKGEINLLAEEIKTLNEELLNQNPCRYQSEDKSIAFSFDEPVKEPDTDTSLKGMKVAFIGGVESLIPRYREVVEYFGGDFFYHCGRCSQGRKEIDTLVNKTDVIFCPVDINSHNACRYAKKACKLRSKPCYFLKSSSLTTLRNVLVDFSGNHREYIADGVSG